MVRSPSRFKVERNTVTKSIQNFSKILPLKFWSIIYDRTFAYENTVSLFRLLGRQKSNEKFFKNILQRYSNSFKL
jgi:hypothetical protein